MNTLQSILIWVGIGVSIGAGICLVIFVICALAKLYETVFPQKKKSPYEMFGEDFEMQVARCGANCILVSEDLHPILNLESGESCKKGFQQKLKELRSELWARDIVLPSVCIKGTVKNPDFNCYIRLENREIFKGEIGNLLSEEQKIDFIIEKIRKFFAEKELIKAIDEKQGQQNER